MALVVFNVVHEECCIKFDGSDCKFTVMSRTFHHIKRLNVLQALPLLFFTNGILTLLYYLGVMQFIIKVIGDFLTFVLETTGIESMAVAAGIFMEGVSSMSFF